jgi:hypothetical protein
MTWVVPPAMCGQTLYIRSDPREGVKKNLSEISESKDNWLDDPAQAPSIQCRPNRGDLAVLLSTGTGTGINTAYLERLSATFRGAMTPLERRGRALARTEGTLTTGMFLVGCASNFCWNHESPRLAVGGAGGRKWQGRTRAMAAGLTDHQWTMQKLLSHQVPPRLWVPPKRRGRFPKPKNQPENPWRRDHGLSTIRKVMRHEPGGPRLWIPRRRVHYFPDLL